MLDNDKHQRRIATGLQLRPVRVDQPALYAVTDVMVGGEFQWGQRENNSDGFRFSDYRVQFSFKYNFSYTLLGSK
jgi:hypothetical protein